MNKPYHFDLETALAAWRRSLQYNRIFTADDLDELEQHVRDQVAGLVADGLSEEAAFTHALREMGDYGTAEDEYRKVYWGKRRRRHQLLSELTWRGSMLTNYFKIALRNFKRHKGYVVLNVGSLSIGIACCMLILLYVQHEWSYDRFHEHADRIYRLVTEIENEGLVQHHAFVPLPIVTALSEVPDIQEVTTIGGAGRRRIQQNGTWFYQDGIARADASVFEVFSFPLRKGNPETALVEPFTVVLTEDLAQKLFGEAEPMGQVITIEDHDYTVTGVLAPIPSASHWHFNALTSQASLRARYGAFYDRMNSTWTSYTYTYLLLPEHAAPEALAANVTALAARLREGDDRATYTFDLQPLTDIHLHSNLSGELSPPGDIRTVYVFSTIALLILLVACINFMNLATARSARRAREVGVRKVVGATRGQLVGQFLGEALLMSGIALFVAVILIEVLLPVFNGLVNLDLALDYRNNGMVLVGLAGTAVLTGLVAGSYPAFFLSSFKPVHALRNRFSALRHGTLRKSLVVVQFTVSTIFITGTGIAYSQLDYVRHKDLGFTKEHILTLDFHNADQYEAFKQALVQHPGILSVTASMGTPGLWAPEHAFDPDQAEENDILAYHWLGVDPDFVETYSIEVI